MSPNPEIQFDFNSWLDNHPGDHKQFEALLQIFTRVQQGQRFEATAQGKNDPILATLNLIFKGADLPPLHWESNSSLADIKKTINEHPGITQLSFLLVSELTPDQRREISKNRM